MLPVSKVPCASVLLLLQYLLKLLDRTDSAAFEMDLDMSGEFHVRKCFEHLDDLRQFLHQFPLLPLIDLLTRISCCSPFVAGTLPCTVLKLNVGSVKF